MRESTSYQAILDEGRAEGRVEGRTEEAQKLLLRMGRKRWGEPEAAVASAIKATNSLERLELLAERIADVAGWQELLQTP